MSRLTDPCRRSLRTLLAVVATLALAAGLAGCGSAGAGESRTDTVTIAIQPGLGYAPLLLAKQRRTLEKALPGKTIAWRELSSGSAVRDGMISGDVQAGAGGIGPFLVGWDSGLDWKVLSSMESMNVRLMAKDPKIRTLDDLAGAGKIAVPAPDSIQAVILKRAAKQQLGSASRLDSQLVPMEHPTAMQALLSGQVAAHFATPPFQTEEENKGAHALVDSYDVFGEHTLNSVFVRQSYASDNPQVVSALRRALDVSIRMLEENPERAARLIAAESGGDYPEQQVLTEIQAENAEFTSTPLGFMRFARFMKGAGLIEKTPASASELFLPSPLTRGGS